MRNAGLCLLALALLSISTTTQGWASNGMVTEPADTMGMGKFKLELSGAYAKIDTEVDVEGQTFESAAQVGITMQPYVGILPFLDVSVKVPLFYTMPKDGDSYFEIGDMDIWTKVMIIDPHKKPIGVGTLVVVTVPTGKEEVTAEHPYPTGSGAYAFYIKGLVSKYFMLDLFGLHGNFGYHRENIGGDKLDPNDPAPNYFDWSGAGDFRLWKFVYTYAEVFGNFQPGSDAKPVNVGIGLCVGFSPLFTVDIGATFGAKDSSEKYSIFSMLSLGF